MLWHDLAWTLITEVPLFCLLLYRRGWVEVLIFAILINAFTNPLAHFVYLEWYWSWYLTEAAVWLTETLILWRYWKMPLWKAALISLGVNAFSALGFPYLRGLITGG